VNTTGPEELKPLIHEIKPPHFVFLLSALSADCSKAFCCRNMQPVQNVPTFLTSVSLFAQFFLFYQLSAHFLWFIRFRHANSTRTPFRVIFKIYFLFVKVKYPPKTLKCKVSLFGMMQANAF